jgi:AcrR family transcriptional regulator
MGNANSGRRPSRKGINSWITRGRLIVTLRQQGELSLALDMVGVSPTSFYRYCRKNPEFKEAVDRALEAGQPARLATMRKHAVLMATGQMPLPVYRPVENYIWEQKDPRKVRTLDDAVRFARESDNLLSYQFAPPDKTLLMFLMKQADPSFNNQRPAAPPDPNLMLLIEEVLKLARERRVPGVLAADPEQLKQAIVMTLAGLKERQQPAQILEANPHE